MTTPLSSAPKPAFEAHVAVARFLSDMAAVAKKTFPIWHKTLTEGIEECPLNSESRRAVLDVHPLDDYYFAGVVALEAWKIRSLFSSAEAAELLGQIGEQVDATAERKDRVVSDLVFSIISRVDTVTAADKQKMPYDQVVKAILQRLGVDKVEATEHLMTEALYRHSLGEPLARGVPHWWHTFRAKYALVPNGTTLPATTSDTPAAAEIAGATAARRRTPRRAVAF